MPIDQTTSPCQSQQTLRSFGRVLALALLAVSSAMGQSASVGPAQGMGANVSVAPVAVQPAAVLIDAPALQPRSQGAAELPDDPGQRKVSPTRGPVDAGEGRVAPIHQKYILAGVRAQPMGAHDKMVIGLMDSYRLTNFGGMFAAAGYEQLRNSQPNYGTDRGAFGERLGAAAIRDTAQGVLTDGVYASLLREDTRYYVEGSQYGVVHRALYALTRPLITRTDSGRRTINGAELLGYASASAISDTYYPPINRNARDNAEAFAGSLGGSALGFVLTEFTSSFWHHLHIGPKE
jgi:hypothetical protein